MGRTGMEEESHTGSCGSPRRGPEVDAETWGTLGDHCKVMMAQKVIRMKQACLTPTVNKSVRYASGQEFKRKGASHRGTPSLYGA